MKLTGSKRLNKLLYEMEIYSYYDVLFHIPRKYLYHCLTNEEEKMIDKEKVVLKGRIVTPIQDLSSYKTKKTFFRIETEKKQYNVLAYNQPYLKQTLQPENEYVFMGDYHHKDNTIVINKILKNLEFEDSIEPLYSLIKGMKQFEYSRIVKKAFQQLKNKPMPSLPSEMMTKHHLVTKIEALKKVHFPETKKDIKDGLLYLKYEEALNFALKNKLIYEENHRLTKVFSPYVDKNDLVSVIKSLPYKLSEDQSLALSEIIDDLNDSTLMYRLLLGDVGSGKTIVAFLTLYANYLRHQQGVLMVPSEALSQQHYTNMISLFKETDIKIALLTGSLTNKEREKTLRMIKEGEVDVIIGTQALFSSQVAYSHLGLVIVDEQHRFGVNQRNTLLEKGKEVDFLMMSATPIPRTLAQTMFSDLRVSTLTSFPHQKRNVKTKLVKDKEVMIEKINETLNKGEKVFIVTPVIETETFCETNVALFKEYQSLFPDQVIQLHGRMKSEEKEEAIKTFIDGKKPILVTTAIVEVGIDISDASLMIIYGANRFGLSSLHQLRGRIGRSGQEALCLLYSQGLDEEETTRLKAFVKIDDGFKLAEIDLKTRGPGELKGYKQSGVFDFDYLNVMNDSKIFEIANRDASYIMKNQESNPWFKSYLLRLEKEIKYAEENKNPLRS